MKKGISLFVFLFAAILLFGCGEVDLEEIKLPQEGIELFIGDSYLLEATIEPLDSDNVALTYVTQNRNVARVDAKGNIKAVGVGETKILVMSGNITSSTNVVVNPIGVEDVELDKQTASIKVGGEIKLNATITPSNATDKSFEFESNDESVASVDKYGNVVALSPGNAIISVITNDGEKEATFSLEVLPTDVEDLKLDKSDVDEESGKLEILIGEDYKLDFSFTPSNATNQDVIFESSDENIVEVDAYGNLVPIDLGEVVITIKSDEDNLIMDTIDVLIYEIPVENIELNKDDIDEQTNKLNLSLNHEYQLEYEINPNDATNKDVTFTSSDPSIVDVDSNGLLTGLGEGVATITIEASNGEFDEIEVDVSFVALKDVDLPTDTTEGDIFVGGSVQILPVLIDENDENYPSDTEVFYQSQDETIATVDNEGIVTFVGVGSTEIIVSHNELDVEDYKTFYVGNVEELIVPEGMAINPDNFSLQVGESQTLEINYDNEPTYPEVVWTSDPENIATVDIEGVVNAVSAGNVTIKAKQEIGEEEVEIQIEILEVVDVEEISILEEDFTLDISEEKQLTYEVLPGDVVFYDLIWQTNNSNVAIVNKDGLVVAVGAGEATIKLKTKDHNHIATVKVEVTENIAIIGLSLNESSLELLEGEDFTLIETIFPGDANNMDLVWESDDEGVVTVNQEGELLAIGEGSTIVRLIDLNTNIKVECNVSVIAEAE